MRISHCGWRRTSMYSSLFAGEGASLGSHLSLRVKAIRWAGFVETNFGEWRAVIGIYLQQISTYSSVRSRTVTVTGHFNWCRTVRPVCWKWSCAHSIEDFVLWLVSSSRFSRVRVRVWVRVWGWGCGCSSRRTKARLVPRQPDTWWYPDTPDTPIPRIPRIPRYPGYPDTPKIQ